MELLKKINAGAKEVQDESLTAEQAAANDYGKSVKEKYAVIKITEKEIVHNREDLAGLEERPNSHTLSRPGTQAPSSPPSTRCLDGEVWQLHPLCSSVHCCLHLEANM